MKLTKESPWDQKSSEARGSRKLQKELAQKLTSVFKEVKAIKKSLRECDIGVKMKPAGIENCAEKIDIQGS